MCFVFCGWFLSCLARVLRAQDKRRLEREKTYYWGQAEELRMSAAAGGRGDPTRDAEHLQLVEQTRELIEENRELRQRAQVRERYCSLAWWIDGLPFHVLFLFFFLFVVHRLPIPMGKCRYVPQSEIPRL